MKSRSSASPEAMRQSKTRGTPVKHELLLLYALHGMLHLCGFDDRTDRGISTRCIAGRSDPDPAGPWPVFAPPTASSPSAAAGRRSNPES